jgi:hypothetical protein
MLEIDSLRRGKTRLVILHQYKNVRVSGHCAPGEEVIAAHIIHRGSSYRLPLSTTHLIVLDYLCRHRRVAQSAAQIAAGLDSELFYLHHGSNTRGGAVLRARTSRTAVRQQVKRIRENFAQCFRQAGIDLDPVTIIRSQVTSTREVKYQVEADVTWEH